MLVEKDQKWTKKGKTYTVTKINDAYQFTYITVLLDGLKDTPENSKVFGVTAFLGEFKFIKEVKDG